MKNNIPERILTRNKMGVIVLVNNSSGKNKEPNSTQIILKKNNSNRCLYNFSKIIINLLLKNHQTRNPNNLL